MQLKRRDGSFTDDLGEIEDILAEHFKIAFEDNVPLSYDQILTEVGTLPLPQLSAHQLSSLDRPVTIKEIEDTVFQLGSHKAPGPDGILAFFYHEYWSIVKFDNFNTVLAFFHSRSLLKSLNATYITLIPKVACLDNVNHFRPISLCYVIYKIISKLLVNHLKPFMDSFITPFQNAFIKGRNISDNILLAHGIFDFLTKRKKRKKFYGALKIDMTKAYNRVDWKFLKAVLSSMNFSQNWIKWILQCVTTVQFTLLVNGSLSQTFKPKRGLRQSDPLSPYLFLLCANFLSLALVQAEQQNKIQGIRIGRNGCTFTHLLFADNSLLFFRRDDKSIDNIQCVLQWYCFISGQSIRGCLVCDFKQPFSVFKQHFTHFNALFHPHVFS